MRGVGWLARLISGHVSQVLQSRAGPREQAGEDRGLPGKTLRLPGVEGWPGGQSICGQAVARVWWGQISLENSDLFCRHSGAQSIPYLSHEAWTDDCIALPG